MTRTETLIVALAAAPAAVPTAVQLLGYDVPLLSALFGVIGVLLAFELAPMPPRRLRPFQKWALRLLGVMLILGLIIYDQKSPFIALGWAIGIGMSTYTIVELLGALVPERLKLIFAAVFGTRDSQEEHNDL